MQKKTFKKIMQKGEVGVNAIYDKLEMTFSCFEPLSPQAAAAATVAVDSTLLRRRRRRKVATAAAVGVDFARRRPTYALSLCFTIQYVHKYK